MSKSNITEEDFNNFNKSNVPRESKEKTASNIAKGMAYEEAFDTKHGRVLTKDLKDILLEDLQKIVTHKHDSSKTISENYDNLMVYINRYQAAHSLECRWEGILKTKEQGLDRIKTVSEKVKQGH